MYLLDTHTLLWALTDKSKLSEKVQKIIEPAQNLYVSIASFWEIAIKQNIGKLDLKISPAELMEQAEKQYVQIVNITGSHLNQLSSLEKIHNDPFDRLLICQAKAEGFKILTKDEIIPRYDVEVVW